jgi:hypothetical protein
MILGGGQLDGKPYLSPAAFKAMTSNHIGAGSGVARDYYYFPGDGYGYGFAVRTDPGMPSRRLARSVNSNGIAAAAPILVSIQSWT